MSININKNDTIKHVLVAPLDWGLGHATRCIPIVNELLAQGFKVSIAASGAIEILLKKEFPQLNFLPLFGYNVSYSKSNIGFLWKMMLQIPSINKTIKRENAWLQNIIKEHKIDIVISDNRFGMYNKNVKCIFITHQLNIQTGNRFTNKIAQIINYKYINKFNACWVPDVAGENNLAGVLSHPKKMPTTPIKYIGSLSRFTKTVVEKNIDIAVILSGPEPQRTIFENIILQQTANSTLNIKIVRGLPSAENDLVAENKNISIENHLQKNALGLLIQSAKVVISRSGYSTVMDMAALQQAAIYVPTPGQTEQEYLAKYLAEKKYCMATTQAEFDFEKEIKKMEGIVLNKYPTSNNDLLKVAISSLTQPHPNPSPKERELE